MTQPAAAAAAGLTCSRRTVAPWHDPDHGCPGARRTARQAARARGSLRGYRSRGGGSEAYARSTINVTTNAHVFKKRNTGCAQSRGEEAAAGTAPIGNWRSGGRTKRRKERCHAIEPEREHEGAHGSRHTSHWSKAQYTNTANRSEELTRSSQAEKGGGELQGGRVSMGCAPGSNPAS